MNQSLYNILFDEVCKLPVIDTHEHLPFFEENRLSISADDLCTFEDVSECVY